jgi:hypothetical protein
MSNGLREILIASKIGISRPDSKIRMTLNNPMASEEIRKKVSNSLKAINHKPSIQGGNGRGLTEPQRVLVESLIHRYPHLSFSCEVPIKTKAVREEFPDNDKVPSNYKVDILCETLSIAIEVDGGSHQSSIRKLQDIKKTMCLELLGYDVIRFKNREIVDNLSSCLATFEEKVSTC